MTDDHIELCPFCKSEAEIQYPGDMFVTCKGCKAMGPMANSDKSAIAVWNRRASPAPAIPAFDPVAIIEQCAIRAATHSQYPVETDFDHGYAKARRDAAHSIRALKAAPAISESEDTERLDWLTKSDWYTGPPPEGDLIGVSWDDKNCGDLRAAIDEARKWGQS
ncbi:Lar family restriction alleviation protein [Burkholderia gladioli]|uniref:Lar family restriction alleviation protein n=1 Tax=Burkholderia gladioli TaxID=28095 RepID=UPI00163FFAD2|nr:Lar family restriction alleviation protein [Burkholderia gladioli]